ncbi:cation channel family protein (macronuclear) [Tetrahymena thermophila SB210]|uniref:Cation channel family protein n=1 Tax=Tetrahymena thermophila (strain SB210) TaxID=312017 RepID=I7M1W3_TETTS|nr:cation channel family protein [Tetrahymena thermophila SB210]EAR97901.3 cation channel family protein [Tetrahymena thermophila SB210]|eukprot:XP_001018146.3 cation channel family protein [Tetrahymena thermophila SB210]
MNSFNNFTSHLKPNNKIKKEREQSLSLMIPQVQSIPLEGDDNLNTVQQMASNHIALSQSAADQQSSKGGKTPRSKKSSRSKDFKRKLQELKLHQESQEIHEQVQKLTTVQKIKYYINKLLDNNYYTAFMTLVTLYALFADDIRVITTEKDEDPYFWGASCFALAAFTIEIILSSIAKDGYFLGFFFWLDLLSTVSLILDIGWIANEIFDVNSGGKGKASSAASLAKASRASRVGTRAGRIVRIVRLVRLVRLYKHAQHALKKQAKEFEKEQLRLRAQQQDEMRDRGDSKVSSSFNQYQTPHGFIGNSNHLNIPEIQQNKALTPSNIIHLRPPTLPPINMDMRGNSHTNRNKEKKQTVMTELVRQQSQKKSTFLNQLQREKSIRENQVLPFSQAQDIIQQGVLNDNHIPVLNAERRNIESEPDNREREKSMSSLPANRSRNISSLSGKSSGSNTSKGSSFNLSKLQKAETKVGKTLSDKTTQKVIIIVLAILISVPLFTLSTYQDPIDSFGPSLSLIYNSQFMSPGIFDLTVQNYIDFHTAYRNPLILLMIGNVEYFPKDPNAVDYNNMREDDYTYYTYSDDSGNVLITSISSQRQSNIINSILSIVRTVTIAIILTVAAVQFNNDVELYLLEPIEAMLKKVTRIAENPLEAAQMEEKEEFAIEQLKLEGKTKELEEIEQKSKYETVVLEKLIIRIGALLAVGFGEAGSEIIAQNMKLTGQVDPMIPGKKIMAVFGFCDIRNFTDVTEVLQTGVMIFVNEIAQITHGVVDQYCGQANKNIGDAFLLVWKFRDKDYLKHIDGTVEFLPNDITSNFADLSVISFLKIMAGITLSNNLKKYQYNQGIKQRLKGYRVRMGFGLHFGWAIEGAIGSSFKIDASYLSPNVNMASRLEAATKQFGTQLLISGPLRNVLSEKCQKELRHIDCVTVKGSVVPLGINQYLQTTFYFDTLYQLRSLYM